MIQVIARSGLQLHFEKDTSEQGQSRLENIDELINAVAAFKPVTTAETSAEQTDSMAAFEVNQFDSPLAEFLAQAALEAGEQQADKWDECVQLMTLHAAKGLEFPLVFMIGLEEGLFPSQQSQEDVYRLEEERRLAYVGITRAEQRLVICYANRRRLHGSEFYPMPSRFIKELPSHCVQAVRLTGSVQTYGQTSQASAQPSFANETGFKVGENVFHQKFGQGMVMATEGAGEHARVQVNFKHAGTKWLVTAFAKLEKS